SSVSPNGKCDNNNGGYTCKGSVFGNCCSESGWCGDTDAHCGTGHGCQPEFGDCT
ncbi:carbohydrate-binding module family 18 protein, partial [Aplosporella prunicola CBS 121167]